VLPALEPPQLAQRIELPADGAAQAVGCSSDGGLLAVAGGRHVSLYLITASGGPNARADQPVSAPGAALLWRASLHCLPRSLAAAQLGGAGITSKALVAMGCTMGLLLVTGADASSMRGGRTANGVARRGSSTAQLLLQGLPLCAVAFDGPASHLAAASIDAVVYFFSVERHGAADGGPGGLLRPLWLVRAPPQLDRPCSLAFSPGRRRPPSFPAVDAAARGGDVRGGRGADDASRLLLGGWLGHVAVIDCAATVVDAPPQHTSGIGGPGADPTRTSGTGQLTGRRGGAPVSAASFPPQTWRLLALHDASPPSAAMSPMLPLSPPPPAPAPALLACCRAPHAGDAVLASPGGAAYLAASTAAPPERQPAPCALRLVSSGAGPCAARLPLSARQARAVEVRGLCVGAVAAARRGPGAAERGDGRGEASGRSTTAVEESRETLLDTFEVACWLDGEGALRSHVLWPWLPLLARRTPEYVPAESGSSAAVALARAYLPEELFGSGRLVVDEGPAGDAPFASLRLSSGEVRLARDSSYAVCAWLAAWHELSGWGAEAPMEAPEVASAMEAPEVAPVVTLGRAHVAVVSHGLVQARRVPERCGPEGVGPRGESLAEEGAWVSWLLGFSPSAAAIVSGRLLLLSGRTLHAFPADASTEAAVRTLELPAAFVASAGGATLLPDADDDARFLLLLLAHGRRAEYGLLRGVVGPDGRVGWDSAEPRLRVLRAPWESRGAPTLVRARGDELLFEREACEWTRCDAATGAFVVLAGSPLAVAGVRGV